MAEIPNRTLQRGLDMLELLGTHAEGMALCELAQALRLPRSTAFNLAQTLTKLGYATQQEDTGKYRLGLKMFEIGAGAMHQIDVMEVIRGCMAEVHHTINETMHLGGAGRTGHALHRQAGLHPVGAHDQLCGGHARRCTVPRWARRFFPRWRMPRCARCMRTRR